MIHLHRMKKVLKIVGITLTIIVFAILVAAVAIPYFYKDEIMQFVTEKIGKQIKGDISLSKVDVSMLGNFPNISIQLHDVCTKSTPTFNRYEFSGESTDTALYAKKVLLSFNVMDFLFENYVVQEIIVRDANVHFFVDSRKHHNWDFSIESDSTGNDMFVELSQIRFRNTLATYHDSNSKINANEWFDKINFSGQFQGDDFFVDMYAALKNKSFYYGGKSFFPESSFKCDVSLSRDSAVYVVKKLKVETPVGLILSDGTINLLKNEEYAVNLNVNVETTLDKIFKVIPQNTVDCLAQYNLKSDIFVEGNLKGKITEKSMPSLVCNVACTNGNVLFERTKYSFSTKGTLKANDISKLNTYDYSSAVTTISTGSSKLSLTNFSFSNFEHPVYTLNGSIKLKIDDVETLTKIEDYGVSGVVEGSIASRGNLENVTNFTKDFFSKTEISADLHCSEISVNAPDNSPYDFDDVKGHIVFSNGNVSVDSVDGNLKNQKFTLQGKASDFVSYLMFDDVDTHCNLNCTIDEINLTPFYEHYLSLTESSATGELLGSIRFEAKRLDFDPYYLTNAAAIIRFTKDAIEMSEINASTLQGKLIAGALKMIDLADGKTKCIASGEIDKMSAKEIFATFDNFDQTVITSNQIDGSLSGKFRFASIMDSDYNPIYPTVDALADVVIEDGSVKNVETLVEVGKKMKMQEEFNDVTFSTMKNTIRLKDDTLYIPDMNIVASAFEMSFAGKHNIENNNFNYYITLFLKKTLSLKFHNKNKDNEDFGEVEKNSDGNFKIPIKIYGNPDDYKVDYDFHKSRENVKTSLDAQKSEWKEIFQKEDEKDSQGEKSTGKPVESDFQIEWD